MNDYAFPRELYTSDAEWRAQGYFQRNPPHAITWLQIHPVADRVGHTAVWLTEASELGLRPGQWPDFIEVSTSTGGSEAGPVVKTIFEKIRQVEKGGWLYRTRNGSDEIQVFND